MILFCSGLGKLIQEEAQGEDVWIKRDAADCGSVSEVSEGDTGETIGQGYD